jgi:hypothetical protein
MRKAAWIGRGKSEHARINNPGEDVRLYQLQAPANIKSNVEVPEGRRIVQQISAIYHSLGVKLGRLAQGSSDRGQVRPGVDSVGPTSVKHQAECGPLKGLGWIENGYRI